MNNILDYLENTAKKYSYATAVDDGSIALEWSQLVELSKRIGTALQKRTKRGKPVVLFMKKSAFTLACMYGTVYAGCFYVIIDPEQPAERIEQMLAVLQPEVIVTEGGYQELLADSVYRNRISLAASLINEEPDEKILADLRQHSSSKDLLYGIFTSGSTGTPKGIVVSHEAVISFIGHFVDTFQFTKEDRIGNQAPFDFDVSVKDIYTSMFTGAALVLIPKELFSIPPRLLDYLCEKRITTLIWAVSALSLVAALKGLEYRVPEDVKNILFSGEVMPVKHLRQWQQKLPNARFINLYGPSEITCNCTYYPVEREYQDGERLPIGRPFPGRKVFLLDEQEKEIVIPAATGEICVSGESLSEGYYHNPEETEKRFISIGNQKFYRTGDLGFYGEDGELYFAGRRDFQVKHMGHRIELEEIEQKMLAILEVECSCCFMQEQKNRIVSFYVGSCKPADVRNQLRKSLPVYMIPQKIIRTDLFPLNKNGKTDRAYFKKKLEVI